MRDHWPEYLSECFGTAIMMTVGIGAIVFMWGTGARCARSKCRSGYAVC